MNFNGDKKANITAAFGSDVVLGGMTGVPNLLLKYYSKLGITDGEMMLIIQLMSIQTSGGHRFPTHEDLAAVMSGDVADIKSKLASLIEKGIISIIHFYSEVDDEIIQVYSYEPLFEKISEIWACEKVKAFQQMKRLLKKQSQQAGGVKERQKTFGSACRAFEKEFGRLLSPMEIEQITHWLDDNEGSPELIYEALKRAVMLGKHNFKYIDSILLEWQKNNLKSVADVVAFEENFRERQNGRTNRRRNEVAVNKKDKFRLLYLG